MLSFSPWVLLLAVLAGLHTAAMAQTCIPPNGYEFLVDSQVELDKIAESCVFFNGSIIIHGNYRGRFYLPNVRHIAGGLSYRKDFTKPIGRGEPLPTSLELPDLESMENSLNFNPLPSLKNVSIPKLRSVGWAVDVHASEEVDLRSLEAAESLTMWGNYSTLRLDSLKEVYRTLWICNKEKCSRDVLPTSALDLYLPSLTTVGSIRMDGRFSDLHLPQLFNVTGYDRASHGIQLGTSGGPPLHISLPQLTYAEADVRLVGGIEKFSMPKVKNMTGRFHLDTSELLNLTLPLEQAENVELLGNFTDIQFPYLKSAQYFWVRASIPFDCDALEESVSTAVNTTAWEYYCTSPEEPSSGLSTGAKIGIGVGVGVGGVAIIAVGMWFFLRRKKKAKALKSGSNTQLGDMPPTYGEARGQDHPPEYASTVAR